MSGRHLGKGTSAVVGQACDGDAPVIAGCFADDEAVVLRHDPRGHEYFWVGGPNAYHEREEGTDTTAVDDGFVSVTPLALEPTATDHFPFAARIAGS